MIEILTIPGILFIAGALLLTLIPQKLRSPLFLLFPLLAFVIIWMRPDGYQVTTAFLDYELILMQTDSLSRVFGLIFSFIALGAGIYAYHLKDLGQQVNALAYAGGALGVTFAGDLLTLVIFWEVMAVTSTWLIWARRTPQTDAAGMRYLLYHILGGGLLFAGILWHLADTGSLAVVTLTQAYTPANVLMLLGVGVNAAAVPFHTWLADAYPKATITGSIFMSAFTTKTAVYVLIRMFPGWEILIWFGAVMTLYGVFYAVICKDIREILSYHIVSQVGYMIVAIGIGTEMALNGSTAHAFNNILYKTLMFMAAGAILYSVGSSKMSHLGGLHKKLRWVLLLYMVGAFSISGIPLFNGFVSKGLTISAAGYAGNETAMLVLLLASVGTWLSVGLKLPYFTWFNKQDYEGEVKPVPANMYIAMGITAAACLFFGVWPQALLGLMPFEESYNPFYLYHFVEVTQILLMTFVVFWLLKKKLAPELVTVLDIDWFFRKAAPSVRSLFVVKVDRFYDRTEEMILATTGRLAKAFENPMLWLNPFTDKKNQATSYSQAMEVGMSFILLTILVMLLWFFLI